MNWTMPDRLYKKFTYRQPLTDFQFFTAPSSFFPYLCRGNSLYDPDVSGTGEVAYENTQWEKFYYTYQVYASKIKFYIDPDFAAAQANNFSFVILPSIEPAGYPTSSSVFDIPNFKYARRKEVNHGSAGKTVVLKHYMSVNKIFGSNLNNDNGSYGLLGGTGTGSTPLVQFYWAVFSIPTAIGTTESVKVNCRVELTYYTALCERKDNLADQ